MFAFTLGLLSLEELEALEAKPVAKTITVDELQHKLDLLAREAEKRARDEDNKGAKKDIGRIRGLHLAAQAFKNLSKWAGEYGIEEPPL